MEYILKTRGISKNYGKLCVLNNVTMHVPKGAIYGFVGRNGAGKTTLIRLICGLQEPTAGGYSINGVNNTDIKVAAVRRKMGAVVETPAIYLDMTAEDNLKQQCQILGIRHYDSIPELLKLVGLNNTGKKRARYFSFGMKQRLGIAVALVGKPDFLVLDEPTNGLDPQGIIEIRELILRLNREQNITVLISSHILDELSRIATHYGFIEKGRIIKEISAEELGAACRKSILVEVTDIKVLEYVLKAANLEYDIISKNTANIYGQVVLSQLVLALAKENCELLSSSEQDEKLEDYFINLIGGDSNE